MQIAADVLPRFLRCTSGWRRGAVVGMTFLSDCHRKKRSAQFEELGKLRDVPPLDILLERIYHPLECLLEKKKIALNCCRARLIF